MFSVRRHLCGGICVGTPLWGYRAGRACGLLAPTWGAGLCCRSVCDGGSPPPGPCARHSPRFCSIRATPSPGPVPAPTRLGDEAVWAPMGT